MLRIGSGRRLIGPKADNRFAQVVHLILVSQEESMLGAGPNKSVVLSCWLDRRVSCVDSLVDHSKSFFIGDEDFGAAPLSSLFRHVDIFTVLDGVVPSPLHLRRR